MLLLLGKHNICQPAYWDLSTCYATNAIFPLSFRIFSCWHIPVVNALLTVGEHILVFISILLPAEPDSVGIYPFWV